MTVLDEQKMRVADQNFGADLAYDIGWKVSRIDGLHCPQFEKSSCLSD